MKRQKPETLQDILITEMESPKTPLDITIAEMDSTEVCDNIPFISPTSNEQYSSLVQDPSISSFTLTPIIGGVNYFGDEPLLPIYSTSSTPLTMKNVATAIIRGIDDRLLAKLVPNQPTLFLEIKISRYLRSILLTPLN